MAKSEEKTTKNQAQEINYYNAMRDRWAKMMEGYKTGKRVVKFKDLEWNKSEQSISKYYSSPHKQDVAAPFWHVFVHHLEKQSGKHRHQGGLPIYVLKGKGYSVINGVRYDWKKGDLLLLPIMAGEVEHQHFNENPDEPAEWMAIRWYPFLDFLANTTKQVETRPNWSSERK